ncbi:MAG: rod shape-determining protein MreD [Beduini sp.]
MNRHFPCLFVIWLAFVMDSVLTYFIPFDFTKSSYMFVPCIGLMTFTLINNQLKKEEYLTYAIIVGGYYAILYADSLFVYVLIYSVIAYFGRVYMKYSSYSLIESYLFVFSTIIFQEVVIYLMMTLTQVTDLGLIKYLTLRLLPTLVLNSVLFVIVYYVHRQLSKLFQEKKI